MPQSALTWSHDETTGTLVMLLTTSLPAGATGDHVFAVVTLEAREGSVGDVSPLALTVRGAARAGGEVAGLDATGGSFRNGVPGDVLGDGTVDQADYDRLAAYLVGEDARIVELNADLDGDGKVTDADAVRLHQYLDGARESP
ncbi:MAG TPA: dockerin type I repeat-containing protein [Candidatus Thermoplasmatota archaeon]|nr:dockerin type I repeat-containing protein [Candidatus Thermoplasmatota archaeon]